MENLEKRLSRLWRRVRRRRSRSKPKQEADVAEASRPTPLPPPQQLRQQSEATQNEGKKLTNHFVIHLRPKRPLDFDQTELHAVVPKLVAAELSKTPRPTAASSGGENVGGVRRRSSKTGEVVTSSDKQRTHTMSSESSLGSPKGAVWSEAGYSDEELHIKIPDSPPSSASQSLLSSTLPRASTRAPRTDFDDSSGYESGYLSRAELITPDLLRPESRALSPPIRRGLPGRFETSSVEAVHSKTRPADEPGTFLLARSATASQLGAASRLVDANLKNRVEKTKFITCTFEAQRAGLDAILKDVVDELQRWIDGSALGIACEMHWTVPEKYRSRVHECRLKEAVHQVLRKNNRTVLCLEDENPSVRLGSERLAESNTRENQRRNPRNDAFEGVYQRCYSHLLPYCHRDTALWHHPYWSWESLDRNTPILLRAFNELSPNVSTERLLRIEVLDEDDNAPEFVQSNSLVFPVSLPVMASSHVGKLQAFDRDAAPNNEFFYYLLPSCNMNFADALMIAEVTGELSTMRKIADLPNNAAEFCALVSLHVADVEFDAKNASMLKFKLREFREEAKVLRLDLYPNNTVLTIDPELSNFELPVTLPVSIPSYTAFSAAQITYDPAIFVQAKPALSASQLFSVDPANGVVRVSPRISEQSEGVYSIKVQALDTARQTVIGNYSHMVHCVADDTKLRFVFGLSLKQLTQRKSSLINDLGEALAADVDNLMVVADQMDKVMTNGFMERSSLCVHATQAGRLMSRDSLHAIITTALKKADSPLSSFYITYKVNDVESCATVHFQHSKRQQNAQSVLLLSCVFCAAVLTTIAACSYFCLLKRYQSYLRMKEQKLSMGTQRRMPMPPPPSFSPMY